jgi:microcystin-dependent protein
MAQAAEAGAFPLLMRDCARLQGNTPGRRFRPEWAYLGLNCIIALHGIFPSQS